MAYEQRTSNTSCSCVTYSYGYFDQAPTLGRRTGALNFGGLTGGHGPMATMSVAATYGACKTDHRGTHG